MRDQQKPYTGSRSQTFAENDSKMLKLSSLKRFNTDMNGLVKE